MKTKIFILQQGYAYKDEEGYKVSATSTLIIGKLNIIVDPGGSWETNEIVNQLKENGLSPSNIDVVVGTHGHSDHIGNINLFPKAKQIVGFDINVGNIYFDHNLKGGEKYILVENDVEIIPTPGHTHSDVSVVVYNAEKYGVVGICGDLFDSKLDDGVWQGLSESIEVQKKNRNMMTELCDFLIPGHGSIFKCK